MPVMAESRLAYRDLKPEIGAEVLAGKAALLGGAHAADIRELLERRGVLVFRRNRLGETPARSAPSRLTCRVTG
jgi:alpha-ketoglutarate-dependent taurine dioxygenase